MTRNKSLSYMYFFEFIKGRTDMVDQMNDFEATKTKTHRWTVLAFNHMLDTIRIIAKTLWCFKQEQKTNKNKHFWC